MYFHSVYDVQLVSILFFCFYVFSYVFHRFTMVGNDFTPKLPIIFACKECDFNTSNKKDYSRHIKTKKHLKTSLLRYGL